MTEYQHSFTVFTVPIISMNYSLLHPALFQEFLMANTLYKSILFFSHKIVNINQLIVVLRLVFEGLLEELCPSQLQIIVIFL